MTCKEATADRGSGPADQSSDRRGRDQEFSFHQRPEARTTTNNNLEREKQSDQAFDHGKDAWIVVAGTWMVQFCTYGYISAFGVYQDYYTRSFLHQRSPSDISWIGSFQIFMQYAPGIIVGRAFDAGYFRHMIALGSIVQVLSMFMLSLTKSQSYYQVFLAQAVGMGVGQSLLFLPSLGIINRHFKRRRALATGVAVSGASVGGIVWPIMLSQITQSTSFPNAIRATASLAAGLLLVANLLFIPARRNAIIMPRRANVTQILQDAPYMVSIASAFCISIGLFFPFFYLQLYAVDLGVSSRLAFYSVALLNAGSFFGRLLPNFLADKTGPYNMLIPCLLLSSAVAFAMLAIKDFVGVAVFGSFYGFWSGSYVSLIPSLLAQFSQHSGENGVRMGIAFSIVGIAFLVGTPIEGALLHSQSDGYEWHQAIIFCAIMVLSGTAGMTISRSMFLRKNTVWHGTQV